MVATVKDTGIDDQGLLEVYEQYFYSFPIYMDEKWHLYKAMGARNIGIWKILSGVFEARKRFKDLNIASSSRSNGSEGWMACGALVFHTQRTHLCAIGAC
jgi:hypothetical protein